MRLPVRILLWVVAFVLGALVVRFLAKITGFAGGDTFFDLLIDGSVGTYLRLFALVPVWALFATLFATAFIDGPRALGPAQAPARTSSPSGSHGRAARARRPESAAPRRRAPAQGLPPDAAAAGTRGSRERSIPRREPAPVATPGSEVAESPVPAARPAAGGARRSTRTAAMPLGGAAAGAGADADDPLGDFSRARRRRSAAPADPAARRRLVAGERPRTR